jgi:uncharacterized membrane protein YkvA (DUF1232 family)
MAPIVAHRLTLGVSLELALGLTAAVLVVYAGFVAALALLGRRSDARALAGFIPDCIVLFRRLLADRRVPHSRKLALLVLLAYLVLPIDLVPDFIPIAGQLDDAILVALCLGFVLRGGGRDLLDEHWPGPPQGARLIGRIAFGARAGGPAASSST